MKILIDTNVFIDLILKREPYFNDDIFFINLCKKNRYQIFINAMSLRDIEYVIRKRIDDKEKIKYILNKIYSLVTKIIPLSADDAINAIFDYEKKFEDYLIASSCQTMMLDCVVTNNKKDFCHKNVKVFSIKEFNEMHKNSKI